MIRDLLLGARLAFAGGRSGWARTAMTAVGVGLGVALLLLAASIPAMLDRREARGVARDDIRYGAEIPEGAPVTLVGFADTTFRDLPIRGRLMRAQEPGAPVPPGVEALPGTGQMLASPALSTLLDSPEGALLRQRLPYQIVGVIGDSGLAGPNEYAYIAGTGLPADVLSPVDRFGSLSTDDGPLEPMLMLLVVIVFVVLLLPVGVFVGTAIRFGSDQRDRRLAALRLIGADSVMSRRIAAGEALLSSGLGLIAGAVIFLAGRELVELFTVMRLSVFAEDVRPSLLLIALIALSTPVAAVGVTLLSLRRVVIEPLGVTRQAGDTRRRLWWRLILPVLGIALLVPLGGSVEASSGDLNSYQVTAGVILLLIGVTALLPWVIEAGLRRMPSGPVSWQLAVRRLQLSTSASARVVNGVAVAVAGAIALQMLFTGISADFIVETGQDPDKAQAEVLFQDPQRLGISAVTTAFRETPGVTSTAGFAQVSLAAMDGGAAGLTVADCETLLTMARLGSCADGEVFLATSPDVPVSPGEAQPRAGQEFGFTEDPDLHWTVPTDARAVTAVRDASGVIHTGVLATPAAVSTQSLPASALRLRVTVDRVDPDAFERLRNTSAAVDPLASVTIFRSQSTSRDFDNIRRGLFIGAVATLLLIGSSLVVMTLEQLRERRRLLAVLVAFGTRRRTISLSVLWQTALPVLAGLILAIITGIGLGALLLAMVGRPFALAWPVIGGMSGIAAAVVLLTTALSLPLLWRLMRPDGLRTE
jgi:hypothetical protein